MQPSSVSLINAAVFTYAAQLKGSQVFQFSLWAASFDKFKSNLDLNGVPPEYHDFADIFSEVWANTLPEHHPHDLQIMLEGNPPPPGLLYSLSATELETLQQFIKENLNSGFIQQASLPHGAPVLFVKKKDGSL